MSNSDDRCIQNAKIAQMLRLLEGEDVITLLSDLHGVISPVFEVYADRRSALMDFEVFMRFCTDFQIFPDVIGKSDAYRIFMNLAFTNEAKVKQEAFNNTRKMFESRTSIISSKRGSIGASSGALTSREPGQISNVIDIHLFVEALAFSALHLSSGNTFFVLSEE